MDTQERWHRVKSLAEHAKWCRHSGVAMPPALVVELQSLANGGQGRTILAAGVAEAHDPLMLTYESAAARLSVSERTVRRLVVAGKLPAVDVGGCRRIRVDDLRAYVEAL